MEPKTWYTVRNINTNLDIFFTISKDEIIRYFKDKDLAKFRVDILEYKPVQRNVSAAEFIKENQK